MSNTLINVSNRLPVTVDALIAHFCEERGNQLYHRFGNAFPAGYREDSSVSEAVIDTAIMDTLGAEKTSR